MYQNIENASNYILSKIKQTPDIVVILGSGLGLLANEVEEKLEINYSDIPSFPKATVQGHAGKLIYGKIGEKTVLMMQGRFHYYEGHEMENVTFPVRVFINLGIKNIIITNAAGGIGDDLYPGDIMLIKDHLSLFMPSALRGANFDKFGPRFPDMSCVYNKELISKAKKVAKANNINVKEGVYSYFSGPRYETPSDIKALKVLGADATGMSTVPEAIVAKHAGMNILGISLITNKAAGLSNTNLSHHEVLETVNMAGEKLSKYVKELIKNIY